MSLVNSTLTGACRIPDMAEIEGIGTRVPTYAQIFISIFTIALAPGEGEAYDSWWIILVTSVGLILATMVKASSIDLYHALIVTWLSFPVFAMSWVFIFLHWIESRMPIEMLLMTHVHGFLFIGLGLWVWLKTPTFGILGNVPGCNDTVQFVLFGQSLRPTGWFRVLVIALFMIWGIVFFLGSVFALFEHVPIKNEAYQKTRFHQRFTTSPYSGFLKVHPFFVPAQHQPPDKPAEQQPRRHQRAHVAQHLKQGIRPRTPVENPKHASGWRKYLMLCLITTFNTLVTVLSIISIEQMIVRNLPPATKSAEEGPTSWSFGQILAMVILAAPVFAFIRLVNRHVHIERLFGRKSADHPNDSPSGSTGDDDSKSQNGYETPQLEPQL